MAAYKLTWTAASTGGSASISGYEVIYTPLGGSPTVVQTGSTATTYILTGLTDGVVYLFGVRVAGGAVTPPLSELVPSVSPLGAPTDIQIVVNDQLAAPTGLAVDATGDGTIDLSWSAPAGTITDYSVEYTPSGGSATTVLVGSSATSYQLTGLTNGMEYSVRVAAVSAAGTGAYSVAVTGTPVSGPAITLSGSVSGSGTAVDPWRASDLNYKGYPYPNTSRTPSPTFTATTGVSVTILDAVWNQGREYDGDVFPVHSPIYINGSQVSTIIVDGSLDTRTVALNAGDVLSFGYIWDNGSQFADAMPGGLRVYVE